MMQILFPFCLLISPQKSVARASFPEIPSLIVIENFDHVLMKDNQKTLP